jgi:hypothetical protein
MMTKEQKRRLRNKYDQAIVREEDLRAAIADWEREIAGAEPAYESMKIALLNRQLEDFRAQLKAVQAEADALRVRCRELDIGEPEPIHPHGAAAAIRERDKRPTQWGMGGPISEVTKEWDAPEVEGSNRRRQRK